MCNKPSLFTRFPQNHIVTKSSSCIQPNPILKTYLTLKQQHHTCCLSAMSTLGSSLKRSFTPSQIMRPTMPRRTLSGSSHGSCPSPSPLSDEQFAFSAGNTPVREIPPSYVASAGYSSKTGTPRDALLFGTRGKFCCSVIFPSFPPIPTHIFRGADGCRSNDVARL